GEINADLLAKAINNVLKNENTLFTAEQANDLVRNYFEGLQKSKQEQNAKAGEKFLAENKTKAGVITLPSGLQYTIMKAGTGPKPTAANKVKTHYHGTLLDGTVFDSSVDRKEPVSFQVTQVIAGWTEALQLMPVGSKWKLFIPSNLAYGEHGAGGAIGPGATLIFEVELLAIEAD
ncbi:MAG: FKBP-type peptidyl-prolyl cis-trans isomerase, partial [Bacteroidia bacterium]|nr:FKBP-type peptidyl-prolyl cis-trans isomerase [Bacteroidia bacterium]